MKEDLSQHTPAMRQYLEAKAQYPDCIVLFRMGDFYETFWDDAVKASEILGIALTKRGKSAGRDVVMAGIPWRQLDRYLAKLVAVGERVAICEQLTPPGKGLIERKVVRVVTPGTLTEEDALDDAERRWLAAVNQDESGAWALAALDFASGRWRLQHGQGASALAEALESLGVAELLAPEDAAWAEGLAPNLQRLAPWSFAPDAAQEAVARLLHVKDWAALGLEGAPLVAGCVGAVLAYLEQTQRCSLAHLELPAFVEEAPRLVIDARTMRNLEAFADMRGDTSMGMFAAIDRTLTPMGKRLLADWMRAPLVDLAAIRARHDAVASLVDDETTRADVRARLRGMRDWERMLGRIVMRRETPRDWLGLAEALKRLPELVALLAGRGGLFAEIVEGMRGLEALAEKLARALNPEPPASVRDPGMISKGFDAELDRLRALAEDKESWLAAFEARERERTGIPNLRVRHNKVFGYFIELTKAQAAKAPPDYVRRQTLTSVERFTTDEL
ncbi:MAG: DNA mismatch repair protein MutS, partial [Zetaproteobacteria bacterium]